ncbi:Uncharacterised protein [Vibrio cholerae]|nr:Uncharacterised protein [Vibrio cholerae]CSB86965.1 Uncharacterised protein [Vibrio cholerae]CSD06979.1 Uncharacterised protein [Vibrio cholerae]
MAGAVETVAADTVLFVQFMRDSTSECLFRHGLVEGGIEHSKLWQAWKSGHSSLDTYCTGWVVERSKIGQAFDFCQYFFINTNGRGEFLTAVHNTVSYRY